LDGFGIRNVTTAENGQAALEALSKDPAHLVISDFNMPKMDGLKLLHLLRNIPETREIGFVLITGQAERQVIEQGRKLQMNNYLAKPFTPEGLRKCIETVVGRL
jgi:two-component system chemotaxis response regulator CheY